MCYSFYCCSISSVYYTLLMPQCQNLDFESNKEILVCHSETAEFELGILSCLRRPESYVKKDHAYLSLLRPLACNKKLIAISHLVYHVYTEK